MTQTSDAPDRLDHLAAQAGISASELLADLYQGLRRMAHRQLRAERANHSLSTTALVHEAWIRLVDSYPDVRFDNERAFLALAGQLMRRVLIAHARQLHLLKHGGGQARIVTYTEGLDEAATGLVPDDLLAVDRARARLEQLDPRQVQLVEHRYFAGFSIAETAELMALSPATVKREWAVARAWLIDALRETT
jgi:RNA polymerase sigma factor (TIGR02999 family)